MSEPSCKIRSARVGEAGFLSDLALRSKAHWGYSSEFLEDCRAELSYTDAQLASQHTRVFVLEHEDRVVGFYVLIDTRDKETELDALFVEPAAIGKGFGRKLVEHAKATALAMGAQRLIIQGDPNAEAFYVALGATLIGKRESGSVPGRFLPLFAIALERVSNQ